MSGSSRVAFHAVPCIIKQGEQDQLPDALRYNSIPDVNLKNSTGEKEDDKYIDKLDGCFCNLGPDEHFWKHLRTTEEEWKSFEDYLSRTRVNINVRQVHKPEHI